LYLGEQLQELSIVQKDKTTLQPIAFVNIQSEVKLATGSHRILLPRRFDLLIFTGRFERLLLGPIGIACQWKAGHPKLQRSAALGPKLFLGPGAEEGLWTLAGPIMMVQIQR